jgi:hypothetical protein
VRSPTGADAHASLTLTARRRSALQRLAHAPAARLLAARLLAALLGTALLGGLLIACLRLPLLLSAAERLAADAAWYPRRLVPSAAFCQRVRPRPLLATLTGAQCV